MIKHNGQYWYWYKGQWRVVPKVDAGRRANQWPKDYQRTTCARCSKRLTHRAYGNYCSRTCKDKGPRARHAT